MLRTRLVVADWEPLKPLVHVLKQGPAVFNDATRQGAKCGPVMSVRSVTEPAEALQLDSRSVVSEDDVQADTRSVASTQATTASLASRYSQNPASATSLQEDISLNRMGYAQDCLSHCGGV